MKKTIIVLWLLLSFCWLSFSGQQKTVAPDWKKVIGVWTLSIDGGGSYIYLNMKVEDVNGKIQGKLTEQSGMIPEVTLDELEFDNENLRFIITAPSPPDGMTRTWKAVFKIDEDRLDGVMVSEELNFAAPVSGNREKK